MRTAFARIAAIVLVGTVLDLASVASARRASLPKGPAAQTASFPATAGDCCSADAMKKIAASLGFIDIVGIKLGMTPQEAVAAVKAHNPNFKIETLTARLFPLGPQGNFTRVPYSINAHSANANTLNGPVEWIAMEFTTPPNPPLVAKVVRYTGFQVGQPVMLSSLLDSLRKKYGQDNLDGGGFRAWVYDTNGKLLTRTLTSLENGGCVGDGVASSVPGGGPADHPSGETGVSITLDTTSATQAGPGRAALCTPLVFAAASNVGSSYAPNSQQIQMTVTIESGALISNSTKATHDWLQVQLDDKSKQQNDAAKQRSGPQL